MKKSKRNTIRIKIETDKAKLFKQRALDDNIGEKVFRQKKGKGSYRRKQKYEKPITADSE